MAKKAEEENECCTDIDIDDSIEIKKEVKSPKSKNSRSKAKAEIKLTDDEKNHIFDSVYDDIYEVVLPNTLWGENFKWYFQ